MEPGCVKIKQHKYIKFGTEILRNKYHILSKYYLFSCESNQHKSMKLIIGIIRTKCQFVKTILFKFSVIVSSRIHKFQII